MIIDPNDANTIYAGGSYYNSSTTVMAISKSINGGANWSRYELSTTRGEVFALALHPTNSNILFAGGYCDDNYVGKVVKSTDGGSHWSDASSGLAQNYNYVYALAIDPSSPQVMYAGCNNGMFKSMDGGSNWVKLNASFSRVAAIVISAQLPKTIYAATSHQGIFCSVDGGANWAAMNEGLTTLQIECLALDPVNRLLFAGTNGCGVFRRDISTAVASSASPVQLPGQFALKSNYPNPFNPQTTITYEIPEPADAVVTLKIFDMAGRLIKTLQEGKMSAGQHSISWDGKDESGSSVTSGVYFCHLSAGCYSSTLKMTLLR